MTLSFEVFENRQKYNGCLFAIQYDDKSLFFILYGIRLFIIEKKYVIDKKKFIVRIQTHI